MHEHMNKLCMNTRKSTLSKQTKGLRYKKPDITDLPPEHVRCLRSDVFRRGHLAMPHWPDKISNVYWRGRCSRHQMPLCKILHTPLRLSKILKCQAISYIARIYILAIAVPMRQWRPVMRRPIMPTDIMASPETQYSTFRGPGG